MEVFPNISTEVIMWKQIGGNELKKSIISILSIGMLVASFTSGVRAEPAQHETLHKNEITYIATTQNIIKTFSFTNLVLWGA